MRLPPRLVVVLLAAVLPLVALPVGPASAAGDSARFTRWTSSGDFAKGTPTGLAGLTNRMTLGAGTTRLSYDDPHVAGGAQTYDAGAWTSPWRSTGFAATSLVPSWNVTTPTGTWAIVQVRVRSGSTTGSWDTVARWASGQTSIRRSSYSSQPDDLAQLATDTVKANAGKSFTGWQIRVRLMKKRGQAAAPTLLSVGGIAANYTSRSIRTSTTTMNATKDLPVPMSSQMTHRGEFPAWGGGGEAWCSPTSTSMVMRYFKKGPAPTEYTWSPYPDSSVDHAAGYTFDEGYDGTGNWPFNTAYAATYALDTFVTRLSSLREAEAFIKAGIPLVASLAYGNGQLTGAPISSTPGHLMVIRGFTSGGKVIANDPAAARASSVRQTYSRSQFEKAWLKGSGGIVYVLRPAGTKLPADTARW